MYEQIVGSSEPWKARTWATSLCLGVAVLLFQSVALARSPGGGAMESLEISDLYVFNTDVKTDGAVILVRDFVNKVVDIELHTSALEPGWAYSIWIAVFNRPEFCSDECGVDDIPGVNPAADERVRPSVFYGGGLIADASGVGSASTKVVPGRTSRELFGATRNYGLENLRGAHIHVVLRSHGPVVTGNVANQIGTANGTCNIATGCQNVFASFHPPIEE